MNVGKLGKRIVYLMFKRSTESAPHLMGVFSKTSYPKLYGMMSQISTENKVSMQVGTGTIAIEIYSDDGSTCWWVEKHNVQ